LPDLIEAMFTVAGPGLAYWDALCGALEGDAPVMSSSDSHGVELTTEDGRRYLLHGGPLHGEAGRPAGVIVSLIDITAIRRAERQREQTLHFLSHDMRSPQASILALIDMQSRPDRALPQTELLGRIGEHAHRTLALADDFIRIAQAESQSLTFAETDLTQIVLDATDEMWALAKARGTELRLDIDEQGPRLRVAPALLARAITNLVNNAIKYSPCGTEVTVRLRRLGPYGDRGIRSGAGHLARRPGTAVPAVQPSARAWRRCAVWQRPGACICEDRGGAPRRPGDGCQ
jgi:signal transduction histidine kinase